MDCKAEPKADKVSQWNLFKPRDRVRDAFEAGRGRFYHVITNRNNIFKLRMGMDGNVIAEKTRQTLNIDALLNARSTLIDAGKQVPVKAQKQWRQAITGDPNKRIRDHLKEVPQVKMLDKFSFTMGVSALTYSEYIILRHPQWFPTFFTWFMLFLFMLRFFMYKKAKYHFFMVDFCYLVNLSCMIQPVFFAHRQDWFRANFAVSMGPLCMSIIVWQNSLVFHSLDKLTSFFLHTYPAILCHLHRWQLIPIDDGTPAPTDQSSFLSIFTPAMSLYLVWQTFYLIFTEYFYKAYLDSDPDLTTSLRYLVKDKKQPMNMFVTKIIRSLGIIGKDQFLEPEQIKTKYVFVTAQFIYTIFLMLPAYLTYNYFSLSCVWLLTIFVAGTWNGASYYIEVFSKRYNMKFESKLSSPDLREDMDQDSDDVFLEALEDLDKKETLELVQALDSLDNEQCR